MFEPGYVIGGRYRLSRRLGEGGMGVVWAAVNESFGREVAIKIMLKEVAASDPTALDRFFTEAKICGSIRHPGIVDVLDIGRTDDGAPFLVMELLDGESLDTVLRRRGTLGPLEILPFVRDIARTLALAHDRGVIHRDIKPGNLFLHRLPTGQIVAKVLDFGISKVVEKGQENTKTQTGTVIGSPAYMSPEQAGGRLFLDPRSDVYGLGVILYESLAGRLPFTSDNYNALIIDIAVNEPPPLSLIAPSLPRHVHELVAAAMAHDRDKRVQSAAALADRIDATISQLGGSRAMPLVDPATMGPSSKVEGGPDEVVARTSYGLTTNAIRYKKPPPWLGIGIAAGVLLLGGGAVGVRLLTTKVEPPPASTARPAADPPASASAVALPSAAPVASAQPVVDVSSASASASAAPSASPSAKKPGKGPGKPNKGMWGYD